MQGQTIAKGQAGAGAAQCRRKLRLLRKKCWQACWQASRSASALHTARCTRCKAALHMQGGDKRTHGLGVIERVLALAEGAVVLQKGFAMVV